MILLFQIYYYRIFYSSKDRLDTSNVERNALLSDAEIDTKPSTQSKLPSRKQIIIEYTLLWCFVFAFGIGAFLFNKHKGLSPDPEGPQHAPSDIFEWKSQVLGWASALLYLGSRIPQIRESLRHLFNGLVHNSRPSW